MSNTWLAHHGIKGQKWGVRRYQNYDGTRIKDPSNSDVSVKAGHKFERVYTEREKKDNNSFKSKRLYVSDNAYEYLNDYFVDDPDKTRIQQYKAAKTLLIAGEDATNNILKEIGAAPLMTPYEAWEKNGETNKTDRDFLMNNKELGERFIKRALEKGYSGVRDPVDDTGVAFSTSAKILFDFDNLEKIKSMSFDEFQRYA